MFWSIYKNITKTLLRSFILWAGIVIVLFLVLERAMQINYGYSIVENNEIVAHIVDTDPEFTLSYDYYIQIIMNAARGWVMMYAMPIFCVISTVLVLNRDFSDGFFEVEKAGNCKISTYFVGRLISLITSNVIVCFLSCLASIHFYYFSRGGISDFNIFLYLFDSTIRVIRMLCFSMFPAILFFISLTYMVGVVFKSGFLGAIVGLGYVLFEYGTKSFLIAHFSQTYHDYLTPKPDKLYQYWAFYDTEWFTEKIVHNPFSTVQMLMCVTIIISVSILFLLISYISLKKRNI